jgi:hypothetical protein
MSSWLRTPAKRQPIKETLSLTIITGASENHARSLRQFLQSVRDGVHTGPLIVYDLGLDVQTRRKLVEDYPEAHIKTFDYSKYPAYFDIRVDAGQYAWKPVILWEETHVATTDLMLWCDAGNRIVGTLDAVSSQIAKDGLYSPISLGDSVSTWTHPGMFSYMKVPTTDPVRSLPPRNGAVLGFDIRQSRVRDLLHTFSNLAQIKACIAPEGSNRSNHRQDQALFTLLYYRYTQNAKKEIRMLSITTHNDVD